MARTIEETRKAKREHMARKRAENPQAVRDKQRHWRQKNLERQRATTRAYFARRFFWSRAMKLSGPDRADYKQLAALWKRQRGRCALSGRRLDRTAQLDHKTPLANGRLDNIKNLQWLAQDVNLAKRALAQAEFIQLCREIVIFRETNHAPR